MKKLIYLSLSMFLMASTSDAQQLRDATTSFSGKIKSYITLKDGTELVGYVKDMDKKAGIMKSMGFRIDGGKRTKLKPEDISFMYLATYQMDRSSFEPTPIDESKPWSKTELNKELINQGYAYFEDTEIRTKNKTKPLLAQLLNPGYSSEVKIYYDPWNGAAIDPTADMALSYYVKKNSDPAAWELNRRKYDDQFPEFWDCEKVQAMGAEWSKLTAHATTYATECN